MTLKQLIKYGAIGGINLPPIRQLVQNIAGNNSIIFMLHRFDDASIGSSGHDPELLRQCLETLHRLNYNLVSVDDIVTAAKNNEPLKNAVAFTVDDGYSDHARVGGEVFAEYDCPATFFLITDFINGQFWPDDAKLSYILQHSQRDSIEWHYGKQTIHLPLKSPDQRRQAIKQVVWDLKASSLEQLQQHVRQLAQHADVELPQQPPPLYAPMSWDDARKLERKGMLLGAHTCRHALLSAENDDTARDEIAQSIDTLNSKVQQASGVFCYPTGRYCDFGEREKTIAEQAGCIGAVSAEPGYHNPATLASFGGDFSVPRLNFPDSYDDFQQDILYIEHFKRLVRQAVQR